MAASSAALSRGSSHKMTRNPRAVAGRNLTAAAARNDCAESTQIIPFRDALAHRVDTNDWQSRFTDAVHADLADQRCPAKKLAQAANSNIRTAENWWKALCIPNSLQLFRIASTPGFENVRALIFQMLDAQSQLDHPKLQRLLLEVSSIVPTIYGHAD